MEVGIPTEDKSISNHVPKKLKGGLITMPFILGEFVLFSSVQLNSTSNFQ